MMYAGGRESPDRHIAPAFSLAETVMSIALVGGLLVVALNTVGNTALGRQKMSDRGRGQLLAQDLMAEILSQDYEEPVDTPVFGRESSESDGSRPDYDDVDDYDAWDSSPPEYRDGTEIANLSGWRRAVVVTWVDPNDLTAVSVSPTNVKRITVEIKRDEVPMARLVAIRGVGLPPPKTGPSVLFVVTDVAGLTTQELARQTLMDSWDCAVELIAASSTQAQFDTAVANVDVAYVSEQISDITLGTKLANATIGVVSEHAGLVDEFGFSSDVHLRDRDQIEIVDATHYITAAPLTTGWVTILSSLQPVHMLVEPAAPGLRELAQTINLDTFTKPSLAVLETGAELDAGGFAAGRRAELPWGAAGFDINTLTADGQTIMKRTIEWAASKEQP